MSEPADDEPRGRSPRPVSMSWTFLEDRGVLRAKWRSKTGSVPPKLARLNNGRKSVLKKLDHQTDR